MAYKNRAHCHRYCFFSVLLVSFICLSGCSQSPVSLIKQAAGEATLIDTVRVSRHRHFIIPTVSHIGLVIMPVAIDDQSDTLNTQLFSIVSKESDIMFDRVFSDVTLLSPNTRPNAGIDFIIRASLLDASPYLRANKKEKGPPHLNQADSAKASNRFNESNKLQRRLRPYHALFKLELLDARGTRGVTGAPMDVAIVKARSGALGSAQFKSLIRQSFAAYSKNITTTMKVAY